VAVWVTILSFGWVPTVQAAEEAATAMDNNDDEPVTQYEDSLGPRWCFIVLRSSPCSEPPVFFSDKGYVDLIFE